MRLETFAVLVINTFGATLAAPAAAGYAQDDVERFRFEVSADAVRLDVAVTTVEARYVPGLTADDFCIYEDGHESESDR